jgi:uncharacterized protein YndB with AHSA1/START domain/DNA-binding transcriptional ArsR family regulator
MDHVFRALADPSRRRLLDSLNAVAGQNLRELCADLDMARQSVSKHLDVLESANLISIVRQGREKLHYLNAMPINDIAARWINRYDQARVQALADLKTALEDTTMDKPEFVYTTYIRTTPEKLWQALTEPAFIKQYWGGLALESDWQVGSPMTWVEENGLWLSDPAQVVLESDPPHRLSYPWHQFTQEWGAAHKFDQELLDRLNSEPRSKVTFEIEPAGELVKLTVRHGGLVPGGTLVGMISQGWPAVISSLKSLLETGAALPVG